MNANHFEPRESDVVSTSPFERLPEMAPTCARALRQAASIVHVALLISFAVASCGSDGEDSAASTAQGAGGGSGAGGAGGTQAGAGGSAGAVALCDAVDPYCEALFACCAEPPFGYTSVEDCKAKFAQYCTTELAVAVDAQVEAGNTMLDPEALDPCIATLAAMKPAGSACSAPPDHVFWQSCFGAFRGQIPPGEACHFGGDFPAYLDCKDGMCVGETCVAFLGTGAACSSTAPPYCNLLDGEWCNSGTCGPRGEIGASCSPPGSDENYACKSMSCGPSGTCVAATPSGLCSQI